MKLTDQLCIRFQGKERIINIPQEIGTSYEDFGLLLLDDQNGRRIHSIAHQHKDDVNQQRGPQRVDCWQRQASSHMKTLIQVLYDIELKTLAWNCQDITPPFLNCLVLGAEVISIECHLCHNNETYTQGIYIAVLYTHLWLHTFYHVLTLLQFYLALLMN